MDGWLSNLGIPPQNPGWHTLRVALHRLPDPMEDEGSGLKASSSGFGFRVQG